MVFCSVHAECHHGMSVGREEGGDRTMSVMQTIALILAVPPSMWATVQLVNHYRR
ncbi:hypothetical protein SEA_GENEVAB15_158 [Mycobacterium phage GenevaB15]|nr:hypothetical protein SEA_GENEVAB15_158 [Mycobacterium phage GenevaB15]